MKGKKYPEVDAQIDNLFEVMVARAPRRPSTLVPSVPNYDRVVLQFARMRQRWKRCEPVPNDTQTFATILKAHGVHIFSVERGYVECQAAQGRIKQALGS